MDMVVVLWEFLWQQFLRQNIRSQGYYTQDPRNPIHVTYSLFIIPVTLE